MSICICIHVCVYMYICIYIYIYIPRSDSRSRCGYIDALSCDFFVYLDR